MRSLIIPGGCLCPIPGGIPGFRPLILKIPGGSSGASVDAAVRAAQQLKAGQKCVVILPDTIRNYMTKFLDDRWLAERDIIKLDQEEKHW